MVETETKTGTQEEVPETSTRTGTDYDVSTGSRTKVCVRCSTDSESVAVSSLETKAKLGSDSSSSIWGEQEVVWTKRFTGRWDDPYAFFETRSGTYDPDEMKPDEALWDEHEDEDLDRPGEEGD